MIAVLVLISLGVIGLSLILRKEKLKEPNSLFPAEWREILNERVKFYSDLTSQEKLDFEYRVQKFLLNKKITSVGDVKVGDVDKLLVASSAIIPMFRFPEYYYPKLQEILIYPEHFDSDFQTKGNNREILGLVGHEGILNQSMILSQKALRAGYQNTVDGRNVGIHEFVHLIDNSDKMMDGLPAILMTHDYSIPFMDLVSKEIERIKNNQSEIDSYGATNNSEFFAVSSELFFENPEKMRRRHPELYKYMKEIFRSN